MLESPRPRSGKEVENAGFDKGRSERAGGFV